MKQLLGILLEIVICGTFLGVGIAAAIFGFAAFVETWKDKRWY